MKSSYPEFWNKECGENYISICCLGWVNLACQMKPFLYSAILRKIRGSHSVSNFTEIIFLKFFDINFENFGAFSLAENKNCLKIIFDHGNEFPRLNWSKKHFFYF